MSPETKPLGSPAKICPECGADVSAVDIDVHARIHWGPKAPEPRMYPDAAKRYEALMKLKERG